MTNSPKTRIKSEETKLKDRKRSQRYYHANKEGILQARRLKYVRRNKDRLMQQSRKLQEELAAVDTSSSEDDGDITGSL
jgi:hypothetical protein